jgi:hypothetical protein
MAALTLQSLDKVSFGNALTWEKKDSAVTSGYKAYLIPNEVREGVAVHVTINSAGNFNIAYLIDSDQAMTAGTQETPVDAFGSAQTASVDVKLSPLVRAVVVTLNSGSIDIVVRAK